MQMPLKKEKNKGVEEYPRVQISEEYPRVNISTEFPRKSIVLEPPFGKDIVNLERKYGTTQGYKLYPYGRAQEEFIEQEHPRDEGGQFADKDGSQSKITRDRTFGRILDHHRGYIERLSSRIQETQRKMVVLPENTLNYKSLFIKLGSMEDRLEEHMKKSSKSMADRKAFNEMGLFEIDMGKSTHKVGSKGFRNGATRNLIKDWIVEDRGRRIAFLHEKETGRGISAKTWDEKVKGKTITILHEFLHVKLCLKHRLFYHHMLNLLSIQKVTSLFQHTLFFLHVSQVFFPDFLVHFLSILDHFCILFLTHPHPLFPYQIILHSTNTIPLFVILVMLHLLLTLYLTVLLFFLLLFHPMFLLIFLFQFPSHEERLFFFLYLQQSNL